MAEEIRGVDLHIQVDTNRRSIVLANAQGVGTFQAAKLLRRAADELEQEGRTLGNDE